MMPSPQRVGEKAGWLHVADVGKNNRCRPLFTFALFTGCFLVEKGCLNVWTTIFCSCK